MKSAEPLSVILLAIQDAAVHANKKIRWDMKSTERIRMEKLINDLKKLIELWCAVSANCRMAGMGSSYSYTVERSLAEASVYQQCADGLRETLKASGIKT